jgi:hypothetical protein
MNVTFTCAIRHPKQRPWQSLHPRHPRHSASARPKPICVFVNVPDTRAFQTKTHAHRKLTAHCHAKAAKAGNRKKNFAPRADGSQAGCRCVWIRPSAGVEHWRRPARPQTNGPLLSPVMSSAHESIRPLPIHVRALLVWPNQ